MKNATVIAHVLCFVCLITLEALTAVPAQDLSELWYTLLDVVSSSACAAFSAIVFSYRSPLFILLDSSFFEVSCFGNDVL